MSKLQIKLIRNLRRSILRGHPWIYKDAISQPGKGITSQLCQVVDSKGAVAWALYDANSPLALRILSLEDAAPTTKFFEKQFNRALSLRVGIQSTETNAFRLFNGEGDLLPGLICDVYHDTAVVQFDGPGPRDFWMNSSVVDWLLAELPCKTVVEKIRRRNSSAEEEPLQLLGGASTDGKLQIKENGVTFKVDIRNGQKTGFFLDQRDNRQFVRQHVGQKKLLNLFSYTGGFSVYAALGGATQVTSVDVANAALALADENWRSNNLPSNQHTTVTADVFDFLASSKETWEQVIVDPPSLCHSEAQKSTAQHKYIELFTAAAKRLQRGGMLSLSSCSSHISFNDFQEIITEALSVARRRGQITRVGGQGADHPFPHASPELRYLKFVQLRLD